MSRWRGAARLAAGVGVVALAALAPAAAPSAVAQSPCRSAAIRSPVTGELVTGIVPVLGSAQIDGFQFYKVEWAPVDQPDTWRAVSDVRREAVINGLLDQWNTGQVPDGLYRLKLTVVDQAAVEICRVVVEDIVVGSLAGTATVTATASPTATPAAPTDEAAAEPTPDAPTAEAPDETVAAEGDTPTATLAPIVPAADEGSSDSASLSAGGLGSAFAGGFCLAFLVATLLVVLFGRRGGQ